MVIILYFIVFEVLTDGLSNFTFLMLYNLNPFVSIQICFKFKDEVL